MRIQNESRPELVVHASAPVSALSDIVLWNGGTPHTGAVLEPVVAAAASIGRHVVSVARAGYGGAPRRIGRTVADAVHDAIEILEWLDVRDVIVAGFSGGGPHALGLGVLCPERVQRVITVGCIAPYWHSPDWFTGMADPTALQAAARGIDARASHPEDFDPTCFIEADFSALGGAWSGLGADAEAAAAFGNSGPIDDDMAFVTPWGFSLSDRSVPVTLLHGEADRVIPVSHALYLADHIHGSQLVTEGDDGHISMLHSLPQQLQGAARS